MAPAMGYFLAAIGVRKYPDPGSQRGDAGSATVWVLALAGLVGVLAAAVVLMVEVRVARAQAATVADLSALAAAARLPQVDAACAEAGRVAAAQGEELTRCVSDGRVVDVEVSRRLSGPLGAAGVVSVRSRAGPPGAQ